MGSFPSFCIFHFPTIEICNRVKKLRFCKFEFFDWFRHDFWMKNKNQKFKKKNRESTIDHDSILWTGLTESCFSLRKLYETDKFFLMKISKFLFTSPRPIGQWPKNIGNLGVYLLNSTTRASKIDKIQQKNLFLSIFLWIHKQSPSEKS